MSLILGLIMIGLIVMVGMFLAQFVIMVGIMLISLPITGISWVVDKFKRS